MNQPLPVLLTDPDKQDSSFCAPHFGVPSSKFSKSLSDACDYPELAVLYRWDTLSPNRFALAPVCFFPLGHFPTLYLSHGVDQMPQGAPVLLPWTSPRVPWPSPCSGRATWQPDRSHWLVWYFFCEIPMRLDLQNGANILIWGDSNCSTDKGSTHSRGSPGPCAHSLWGK